MNIVPSPAGAAVVRAYAGADAPHVAQLFLHVFHGKNSAPPERLIRIFNDSFVQPDGSSAAFVHLDKDGQINGFVGAVPQYFALGERNVSALVVGSLMVKEPQNDPLAGARLLRALMQAGYDAVVSETANPVSQKMWEKSGGTVVSGYSLDYFRILKPIGFFNALASYKFGFLDAVNPLSALADRFATRFFPVSAPARSLHEKELSVDDVAQLLPDFAQNYGLAPAFAVEEWARRMGCALLKEKYGACIRRGVFDAAGRCVGLYVFHGDKGKVGQVLQVLAKSRYAVDVVAFMLNAAQERGVVGLRGRSVPDMQNALAANNAAFVQRSSLTVYTKDAAILAQFQSGQALATGLAGETWIGLIGGKF